MSTLNRTVETVDDKKKAVLLIENRNLPFTLSLADGKHRSTAQNKLGQMWMAEIAQQKGDTTPEEVRGYCKLHIGVPILRSVNEVFAKEYDAVVKPLPYEAKLKLMMVPFDFGVTRLMTTKQKTQYLDAIARHFGEQGIILTMPEDMRRELEPNPNSGTAAGSDDDGTAPSSSTAPDDPAVPPPDPGSTAEPATTNSTPPSDVAGSPSLLPKDWIFVGDDLKWLKDFAEKAIRHASDKTQSEVYRQNQFDNMAATYKSGMDIRLSDDAKQAIDAMEPSIRGVWKGREPRLAREYLAREIIGCNPEELKGQRNV